jgi:hypothetical protein
LIDTFLRGVVIGLSEWSFIMMVSGKTPFWLLARTGFLDITAR